MKSSSDEVLTNFIFGISRRGVKVALDQWLWIEDQDLSSYNREQREFRCGQLVKLTNHSLMRIFFFFSPCEVGEMAVL